MAPAVRARAVRRDRPLRAHPPALFPLQSARVHHGIPAGAVSRRGRGALGPALRAARLARRGGAAADLAHRRAVRTAVDPIRENAAVAPAKRELTFLLADPERRLLRAVAARLPAVVTPDHLTGLGPAEVRIMLIAANAALAVITPGASLYLIASATLGLLGVGMMWMLVVRVAQNLSRLSREEPYIRRPHPSLLTTTERLGSSASA